MKNCIKKIKTVVTFLMFGIFICTPLVTTVYAANAMPELSSDDLKMLEEIGKEVEKYVNSLPTEAQLRAQGLSEEEIRKRETKEKFDAEVKRYSEMSEKQLLEEMEKVFAEAASQMPPPPVAPEVAPPPAPIVPEIPKPIIPSDKQLAALKLIETVLLHINNFMNKAQIMIELPGKIPSWVKEGKLRNWPANLTWNAFSTQVEEFQVKLNKIKDRDPRTGSYKYLDDFIKDESLNNNLTKVRDSLMRSEPKIELSSFGIDKMTSESRAAVRNVLLSLHEATSILGIPAALDKIIEKYEPTAKKIKESEEAAQKRALEESRRIRYPGPSVVSTMPPRERLEVYGRGREFERFNIPSYETPSRGGAERPSETLRPGEKGAGGGGAGGEKKPEAAKKAEEKPKREPDKKADQYEGEFLSALEAFMDAVHENAHFTDIEKHVKSGDPVDEETIELIKIATDGVKKASNAVRKMKLQLSKLNENQKKEYKKALKDGYKNAKKDIDSLTTQLNNISKASNVIGALPLGTGPAHRENIRSKYYAYFGKEGQTAMEEQYETKKKNLDDLKDDLEAKRAVISEAKKKAELDRTPLPPNIVQLENETVKMRAQIKTLEADIKKFESMLSHAGKANLHDLQTKIKDLKKAVDEL